MTHQIECIPVEEVRQANIVDIASGVSQVPSVRCQRTSLQVSMARSWCIL